MNEQKMHAYKLMTFRDILINRLSEIEQDSPGNINELNEISKILFGKIGIVNDGTTFTFPIDDDPIGEYIIEMHKNAWEGAE